MSYEPVSYWESRYQQGRDSGEGSRGQNAINKAEQVNLTVSRYRIRSIVDWGCGDGQVLRNINPMITYVGVDVSAHVLGILREQYPDRLFVLDKPGADSTRFLSADLSLSMDVLFHLVNDDDYRDYLGKLFGSARRVVLIYSTNYDGGRTARHVLRRRFTPDVQAMFPDWRLVDFTEQEDPTRPGFYTYLRSSP